MKLFDEKGYLLLDELVMETPSYKQIVSDCIITDEEIATHSLKIVDMLRMIDSRFEGADKMLILNTICEIAVLYELALKKETK